MKQAAVRKSTEILLLALRRLGLSVLVLVLVLVAAFISTASLKLIRRAGATHQSSKSYSSRHFVLAVLQKL
jgi:hypothetical protein